MKDCVSCMHEHLSPMSDTCRECGIAMLNYEEAKPKPITNADRIRGMTDEELAEWVWSAESSGRAYGVRGKNAWLNWLKAPVESARMDGGET